MVIHNSPWWQEIHHSEWNIFQNESKVKALSSIKINQVNSFLRKIIICGFSLPQVVITNNGMQFVDTNIRGIL